MADAATTRLVEPGLQQALAGVEWGSPCVRCSAVRETLRVNTIRFDVLDEDRLVDACRRFVSCGESHVIHFLAAHPTVAARQVPKYRALLNSADLVVSDGTPIAAVMRVRDRRARRLTSTDAFLRLCDDDRSRQLKHYFVGGSSTEVAAALENELRRRFPRLKIAGFEVPPFRPYETEELKRLAKSISESGADIVWVGIGAPKQEILAHRLRLLGAAPVIACIGATFDFVAGTKARAPRWMRAVGAEWLFRLVREPRRLWRRYLIGNTMFLAGICSDEVRRLRTRHTSRVDV